jgi:RNA polymerase primary sigma factor
MSEFKVAALKQLTDQQVRFAPPARRQQQLARAERLLTEVESARQYPYQYVCYRVTEFRPDAFPDLLIDGRTLEHDLCLLIDALSRSTPALPVEQVTEPVLTLDEVSRQLNVSTKTISRWRECGLVSRRVLCNGRRQVGFVQSVVERFVARNRDRVERGGRFSQLSQSEREDILRRAKRLARVGHGSLTEVSRRIGRRLGRSAETVRYTIKNYDRDHPEQALYPEVTGPLDGDSKQVIFNSYRRGIPVDTLAKRFNRNRNSVYRVINEERARRLLDTPLDYIANPTFDNTKAERDILAPMPDADKYESNRKGLKIPKDAPAEFIPLYQVPLLSKDQEQHLFRKMNYLKHKASMLRARLNPARARTEELDEIDRLQAEASRVKDQLIRANQRLVVSIAKKHAAQTDNLFELVSDGNMSLIRAVEKFDYSRGNKFSTYASWAIMKNFARSIPEERRRRERYVTGHEDMFDAAPDNRSDEGEILASAEQIKFRVNRLLDYLDPREKQIIRMRAGLDDNSEGMTLEEIGHQLGITKERVRQLNVRIMNKLRTIAREQNLDQM